MQQLITKVSEVTTVLGLMVSHMEETKDHYDQEAIGINIQFVKANLDTVRKKVMSNNFYSSWQGVFMQTGGLMLYIANEMGLVIEHGSFGEFLLKKHKAYGAEPFADWREVGILMRLGSKMARLINLKDDTDIKSMDESFQDTFRDVIGYCVLGFYIDRLPK